MASSVVSTPAMETPEMHAVTEEQTAALQAHIAQAKAHWSAALFAAPPAVMPAEDATSAKTKLGMKIRGEYGAVREPNALLQKRQRVEQESREELVRPDANAPRSALQRMIDESTGEKPHPVAPTEAAAALSSALVKHDAGSSGTRDARRDALGIDGAGQPTTALVRRQEISKPKPKWHAPWKLMRVISGHMGWVRAVSVDPSNEWFATGAGDRVIKIWDLASGTLKLSLTGHISAIRGIVVSPRHPYLFSAGEDKQIKCWDLEYNKVIRQYHGHLSGIYSLSLHPTLDVLVSGGRDSVARVWDMRTRANIHTLVGHKNTVASTMCFELDPQVITGSMDSTIRCWDLAAGKCMTTLTHHKKSIRALTQHPTEFSFASASPDNVKQWDLPQASFVQNFSGHNAIVNTMAVNRDEVMFTGADNGSMHFWDWKSGHSFQKMETTVQPGSLESEAGIFCSSFDRTGTRLITGEADKTVKIWKEDDTATEESHPIANWKPEIKKTLLF